MKKKITALPNERRNIPLLYGSDELVTFTVFEFSVLDHIDGVLICTAYVGAM